MNAELAAAQRKARALASLAESSTFEGERQNARDAYFRICDAHGLDSKTLQPMGQQAPPRPALTLEAFYAAQAADPSVRYEQWLAETLNAVLRQRRQAQA